MLFQRTGLWITASRYLMPPLGFCGHCTHVALRKTSIHIKIKQKSLVIIHNDSFICAYNILITFPTLPSRVPSPRLLSTFLSQTTLSLLSCLFVGAIWGASFNLGYLQEQGWGVIFKSRGNLPVAMPLKKNVNPPRNMSTNRWGRLRPPEALLRGSVFLTLLCFHCSIHGGKGS